MRAADLVPPPSREAKRPRVISAFVVCAAPASSCRWEDRAGGASSGPGRPPVLVATATRRSIHLKGRRANESEQGQTVVCARPERSSSFAYCLAGVSSHCLQATVRLRSWARLGFGLSDQYDFCPEVPCTEYGWLNSASRTLPNSSEDLFP